MKWIAENLETGEKVNMTKLAAECLDQDVPEYELHDLACATLWPDTPADRITVYGEN